MSSEKLPKGARQIWLPTFGNTADGVFITNAALRILFWNKGAEKLLGYSQAEVLNQHCYEVLAGRYAGKLWCHANCNPYQCAQRGGLPDGFQILTHTNEDKQLWIDVSVFVLPGRKKPLLLHLFRDATHQKRNEETIQNMLSLLGVHRFTKGYQEGENSVLQRPMSATNGLSALTRREVEVLQLLAEGLSSTAIAQRISISPFTVRNHVRNTLKKLGLHSRAQAISFGFANHLF